MGILISSFQGVLIRGVPIIHEWMLVYIHSTKFIAKTGSTLITTGATFQRDVLIPKKPSYADSVVMPSPPTQVSTMTIYVFNKCVLKAMLTVHIYTSSFVGIGR